MPVTPLLVMPVPLMPVELLIPAVLVVPGAGSALYGHDLINSASTGVNNGHGRGFNAALRGGLGGASARRSP